jgi:hypothetical protein
MKRHMSWAVLAVILIGAMAAGVAVADDHHLTVINNYGVAPFVYGGYSYVPLKSTADYLGAGLLWDSLSNRATVTYRGHELGLVIGNTTAYYMGRPVVLPAPPVIVEGQCLVPVIVFDRYFDVPIRWEPHYNRVLILGPPGWGYYRVLPTAPPYVVTIIQGYGPPPWAPAHGYRRQGYGYYPTAYVPAPFIYGGVTYIPLRDVTDLIGVALLWDSLSERAAFTYNGHEIGLVVGSPTIYYGPQVVVLQSPPIIVRNTVYVPSELFDRHMRIPIERGDGVLKVRGPKGWRDFRLASAPSGDVYLGRERERERERERDREQVRSPFDRVTQRGPEPGRGGTPWARPEQRPTSEPPRGNSPWLRTQQRPNFEAGRGSGPQARTEQRSSREPARGSGPSMRQTQRPAAGSAGPPPKSSAPQQESKSGGQKGGGWFSAKDKGGKGK